MFRTAFLIALFLLPNLALAQTFNVSTTAQLRSAFENAAVNGEDDTIILEAGTYKTTADSLGTFKFSDTEAHNLTIKAKDGLTATDVVLDGANTHQVFNLNNVITFTVESVTIKNGKNSRASGGGIYSKGTVLVINSIISGNTATNGGGIDSDSITVGNSTISNNKASYNGGGLFGYTITVTNSIISGNTANFGGGIDGETITVANSTISGNTASYIGGGIHGESSAIVTVVNSIISGNTTLTYGGGISGSVVTAINSTISGNTAGKGGGIFISMVGDGDSRKAIFVNNIFHNNSSDFYLNSIAINVYNYIDYTKIENMFRYAIVQKNNIQPSSSSLIFADSSFRLRAGSVAIDKGLDPNSATFKNLFTDAMTLKTITNALKTDKDGKPRIIGAAIDLGPYEYR